MMTLAELQALSAFLAPQQAGALSPVLAMVPMFALKSGVSIDGVYTMDARTVIGGIVDMLPDLLTTEMQSAAGEVTAHIAESLSPENMRKRMMARIAA